MKTCLRCNTLKDTSEFGKETRRSDGLRPYCKPCTQQMTAAYREDEAYKDRERQYARDYNNTHKEERREYRRTYEASPEVKDLIRTTTRHWWSNNLQKKLFYSAKDRAKEKNLPFALTPDDIIIPDTCPVLGIPLFAGTGCVSGNSPSVDQIIPGLGYVPGNFQIISYRANTLKSNGTIEELEMLLRFLKGLNNGKGQSDPSSLIDDPPA